MGSDRLVTVCKLSDLHKAELVKATLLEHGLACQLDGEHQGGFAGVFDIGVIVHEKDSKKARQIINDHYPEERLS